MGREGVVVRVDETEFRRQRNGLIIDGRCGNECRHDSSSGGRPRSRERRGLTRAPASYDGAGVAVLSVHL
jgi:hypothetical protein